MQIVYHIGANCTDADRLLTSMLRNARMLASRGIKVPGPGSYRRLLRETIQNLAGTAPPEGTRDVLLDAIIDDTRTERLVLSNSAFICVPARIFEEGTFYAQARAKLQALRGIFPDDDLSLFLGMRNPATFLPRAHAEGRGDAFADFMHGLPPEAVRWSDLVAQIRRALPDVPLTVWCNEDTPLLWGTILRRLAGLTDATPLAGEDDLLESIMKPVGIQRLRRYLQDAPPATEAARRRIVTGFLERYAMPDMVEQVIDLPGWTDDTVARLTRLYDEDMARVAAIPGVVLLGA